MRKAVFNLCSQPCPSVTRARAGAMLASLGLTLWPAFPADSSPPAEPLRTSITVVGEISAEAPGSVAALAPEDIRKKPGVNLDDRLRDVPGFSLFRRSSSLTAHPTTQGVSLRGIGSTGASRTLVLWDGVPINRSEEHTSEL